MMIIKASWTGDEETVPDSPKPGAWHKTEQ